MKTTRWLFALLLLASACAPSAFAANQSATPAASPIAEASGQLSTYDLAVALDPSGSIAGTERLHFVNATGETLRDLGFRLYPNADYYGVGSLTVSAASIDGHAAVPVYAVQNTAMTLPLATPLAPGGTVEVVIDFTTVLPLDSTGSYGIFTRHSDTGDWIVSDWQPIVAGRDANGWRFDPPGPGGDPTFSDAARYSASITAPAAMTIVASGGAIRHPTNGATTVWTIAPTTLREFTFVASTAFQRFDRRVGAHLISAYLHAGANVSATATIVLDAASNALALYERSFGPYTLGQLDVLDVPMLGALGVSWTGLLFINGQTLFPSAEANPERLEFTIAHEISHQWWGAIVGSNTNDHAFLAEGMANCSAILFFLADGDETATLAQLNAQIVRPYLTALYASGDGVVDRPSNANPSGPSLSVLIYGKAALGFLAIREAMGADAFAAALRAYAADFTWRISSPDDLRAELRAKTAKDIDALWTKWFESATVTADDVQTVIAAVR